MKRKPDAGVLFQALADPTRRTLVEKLSLGPISVSKLAEPLEITLAAVVQHVQVLEECGIVVTEKTGRVRTVRLEPGAFDAIEKWVRERRSAWERRLDRLGDVLGER